MRFVGRIELLVKNLRIATDAETQQRILGDALAVINSGEQSAVSWQENLIKQIRSYRMIKIAGLAAIGTVALVATQYLIFLLQIRFEYSYAMGF